MIKSDLTQPDLDWSQVRETVKLFTVSVMQVETCMKNGDASVNSLTESFTSLVAHMNSINEILLSIEHSDKTEAALNYCTETTEKIQISIVAFQFYDRLQQSLSHVAEGLKGLSLLVKSLNVCTTRMNGRNFSHEIRGRYTMESEKIMFDAIVQGKSIEQTIQLAAKAEETGENEIEFF